MSKGSLLCLIIAGLAMAHITRADADEVIPMRFEVGIYTLPVTVSNGNTMLEQTVSFDTGASFSALPVSIILALRLKPRQEVNGSLADGTTVKLTLYTLPKMIVGGCVLRDSTVLGIPRERGILGMHDLEKFKWFSFRGGHLIISCSDAS